MDLCDVAASLHLKQLPHIFLFIILKSREHEGMNQELLRSKVFMTLYTVMCSSQAHKPSWSLLEMRCLWVKWEFEKDRNTWTSWYMHVCSCGAQGVCSLQRPFWTFSKQLKHKNTTRWKKKNNPKNWSVHYIFSLLLINPDLAASSIKVQRCHFHFHLITD